MGFREWFKFEKLNINGTKVKVPRKGVKHTTPIFGKFDKFPVLAIIFEKRGSSYLIDFDWAGFFKDDKNHYYKLKKKNATFKPPQYSQVKMTPDGKNVLVLWSPARGQYIPKDVVEIEKMIGASERNEEIRIWLVNEVKRITSKGQDWLTKNLPLITFIMVMTMVVIVVYVSYDGIAKIVGDLKGITGTLSEMMAGKLTQQKPPTW